MKNVFLLLLFSALPLWAAPDLLTLKSSGFIMGPGQAPSYPIDKSWADKIALMKELDIFDDEVARIEKVFCGGEQNKAALIVGEPNDFYRYIFARLAAKRPNVSCPQLWHVEIDIAKIEAGHIYVGQVEEYWERNVHTPAFGEDVVLYFSSLSGLIGLGSHSEDSSGIEVQYVADINSGQLRTVAYTSKYEYNAVATSANAYVLHSFADTIFLKQPTVAQTKLLLAAYFKQNAPQSTLADEDLDYLMELARYYQPNVLEPERSLNMMKYLIRHHGAKFEEKTHTVAAETAHPYERNKTYRFDFKYPDVDQIQVVFENFESEQGRDQLKIHDGNNYGREIISYSGNMGAFKTSFLPSNNVFMLFSTDGATEGWGFKVKHVVTRKLQRSNVSRGDIRRSVMEVVGVPRWLVERDWSILRELPKKLEDDVVGCEQAKADVVSQLTNGYVTGRTDEKPLGSVLFVGPTGTGKSYIAKKAAEFMSMKLITIDMTSFRTDASFDRFQEVVSANLALYPFAYYLFEEIDKASPLVLDRLYFMLDEGIFYDKYQRPLSSRGAFVMMTTNAAEHVILRERDNPNLAALVHDELEKFFRPSFINRFNAVSIFRPFTDAQFTKLAKTLVDKKVAQLKQSFKWVVTTDQATIDFISLKGRSDRFGARPMERLIENIITNGLTIFQMDVAELPPHSQVKITKTAKENEFSVSAEGRGQVSFVADIDINSKLNKKLKSFFESIRLY